MMKKILLVLFVFIIGCMSNKTVSLQPQHKTASVDYPYKESPLQDKEAMFPKTDAVKNDKNNADNIKQKDTNRALRIGLLLPLSGQAEKLGEALKNSALMAQFEVADDDFVMQFYDTHGRAEKAIDAFNAAVADGVDLIIGPLFASEVKAITPLANDEGIKVISFTSDTTVIGHGIYSVALLVPQQIERIVAYACKKGSKKFALVTRDDEYGKTIADALGVAVGSCEGAEISGEGYYDVKTNNIAEVVKLIIGKKAFLVDNERAKQKSRTFKDNRFISESGKAINLSHEDFELSSSEVAPDFDTILIADDGNRLRSVSALLSYYDISPENTTIIGTSLWNDNSINREPSLRKGAFPALDEVGFKDFSSRFKNLYGKNPPRIASQAYDAVALVATLIKSYDKGFISDEMLTNPAGFLGIDGIFRLNPNGFCERALAIYEVGTKENYKIVPPPEFFEGESIFKNYEFQ